MRSGEFYELCEQRADPMLKTFGSFDITCLYCTRRIGAHSWEEFEDCARRWQGP